MILDLILKQNSYFLKINKKLLENKSTPLSLFQADVPLMQKYAYLGLFHISPSAFGFDACFKIQKDEGEYLIYEFKFPKRGDEAEMRKMLLTIYLSTYYVVEQMFYDKEFLADSIWEDQSLSFVIFDGGSPTNGYSIGGQLYPWFKKKLFSLCEDDLLKLNEYVISELKRIYSYFRQEELSYAQVTIMRESFFVQVNMGGRWISWKLSRSINKPEEFSSHSIDFHSDQELCFAAIVAMNTWLREN